MKKSGRDMIMTCLGRLVRPTVYVTLCLPAMLVVLASLTGGDSLRFPPEGLSVRWYKSALQSVPFMTSLVVSTRLAFVATLFSLMLGLALAIVLDRFDFFGKRVVYAVALAPLAIPMVILGVGLLQFLNTIGLNQTFIGLAAGHVIITLPYVVRTLLSSFSLYDKTLDQAAMSLRASPRTILLKITIPMIAPALVSASVFSFVTSFGNITLSIFLGFAKQTTLPVQIFTYVEHSYEPILAAISSIVIAVTLVVLLIVEKTFGMERLS